MRTQLRTKEVGKWYNKSRKDKHRPETEEQVQAIRFFYQGVQKISEG
jgi:hypothetical protein